MHDQAEGRDESLTLGQRQAGDPQSGCSHRFGTVMHWGTGLQAGPIPGLARIVAVAGLAPSGMLGLKEDGTLVQSPVQSSSPIPPGLSNVVAIGGIGVPSVALVRGTDEPFVTHGGESWLIHRDVRMRLNVPA